MGFYNYRYNYRRQIKSADGACGVNSVSAEKSINHPPSPVPSTPQIMENAFDLQELIDAPGGIFDFDVELDSSSAEHSKNLSLVIGSAFQSLDFSADAKDSAQASVDATIEDGNDFWTSFQGSFFAEGPESRFTELVEEVIPNESTLISSNSSDFAVQPQVSSSDLGAIANLQTPQPAAMPALSNDVIAVPESLNSSSGALVQKKKRYFPVAFKLIELELELIGTNGKPETIHLADAVTYVVHSVGNETARYIKISTWN
jgi:hypothetical protein